MNSTLSQDTIIATHMLTSTGVNTAAPFANPFAGGSEEMVYIDVSGQLVWLRHSNSGTGWELQVIAPSADQVVVAVHPNQVVCAFALVEGHELVSWRLGLVSGTVQWEKMPAVLPPLEAASRLSLQYLNDRPSTPFVFVVDHGGVRSPEIYAASSRWATPDEDPSAAPLFGLVLQLPWVGADLAQSLAIGVDGFESRLVDLRAYWIRDGVLYMTEWTQAGRVDARLTDAASSLAGLYNGPTGVGCVAMGTDSSGRPVVITYTPAGAVGDPALSRTTLDHMLTDAVTWQDQDGRMHVFGAVTDGGGGRALHVLHQTGVHRPADSVGVLPVWETPTAGTAGVALTRPLIPDVRDFAVDAHPDEYPSQHVMHAGGLAAERCAFYTQDVSSTWWSREIVRLSAQVKPYVVTRYKSEITLTNSFDHPVPAYPVTITAAAALDFEVQGVFYRTGPDQPVALTTDYQGKVTVKVVARALTGSRLTLNSAGLPGGVVIDPAAPLHAFLGGTGTLPTHQHGLSAQGLQDAKTSDGKYLVQAWHGDDDGLSAVPQPQDVVDWCAYAFGPATGLQSSPPTDSAGNEVLSVLIQTWDADRPAYEVVTSQARRHELTAQRQSHPQYGGFVEDLGWVGDIWQGISDGLLQVKETVIHFVDRTVTLVLAWADGLALEFRLALNSLEDAAHYVASVFNSLQAKLGQLLDWMTWFFDFGDIITTKNALLDGMRQWPAYMSKSAQYVFGQVTEGWFVDKEADVKRFFDEVRSQLAGVTTGSTLPPMTKQATTDPSGAPLPDLVAKPGNSSNGHTNWMMDQMTAPSAAASFTVRRTEPVPPEFQHAADAFADLMEIFADPAVGAELRKALEDFSAFFVGLFDFSDPSTFARTEIVHALDFLQDIVLVVLTFCEAAVAKVSALIQAVLACIPAVLDLPAFDPDGPLALLWEFICEMAGVPATTPTLGDFFGTATAMPITLISKAVTGQIPFPDGKFPVLLGPDDSTGPSRQTVFWPPGSSFTAPSDYPMPPIVQTFIQMLVGVATCIFAAVDLFCDQPHKPGEKPSPHQDILIVLISVFDMIAFGLGDMPVFYGSPNVWECKPVEGLWWGEYFCKLPIYLGDIALAIIIPFLKEGTPRRILGTMQDGFGNMAITVLGLIETGFSITLMALSDKHVMDVMWVVSQLISLVSSDTAFWRVIPNFAETAEYKMGVDATCDLVAGAIYSIMGLLAWGDRDSTLTDNIVNHGTVGEVYDPDGSSTIVRMSTLFPPFGWAVEKGALPPGLSFAATDADNEVRIAGTPTTAGTYTFQILSVNSYDPNIAGETDLKTITIAPAG